MKIDIRPAKFDDAQFLALVIRTASRSYKKYKCMGALCGRHGREEECLSFLRLIATTQRPHYFITPVFL